MVRMHGSLSHMRAQTSRLVLPLNWVVSGGRFFPEGRSAHLCVFGEGGGLLAVLGGLLCGQSAGWCASRGSAGPLQSFLGSVGRDRHSSAGDFQEARLLSGC